jgi:hypothetical protein
VGVVGEIISTTSFAGFELNNVATNRMSDVTRSSHSWNFHRATRSFDVPIAESCTGGQEMKELFMLVMSGRREK